MTDLLTPRIAAPLLAAGQAQKELTHNEALILLDALTHPVIENATLSSPPAAPLPGQVWLVASGATGAWAGASGTIALWSDGGWRFITAFEGLTLWDRSTARQRRFHNGAWILGNAVALPTGGTTIDAEARTALAHIAALLGKWGMT